MLPNSVESSDVITGVDAFNSRYGEMEKALSCLANASRQNLLRGEHSEILEELVWTIKSWWGVQGVKKEVKGITVDGLLRSEWNRQLFSAGVECLIDGEDFAIERVNALVQEIRNLGWLRREWSLASKVLHWLLPWRIPVYDSFVKRSLGLSLDGDPKQAYSRIVQWEFDVARRLLAVDERWLGEIEPRSPFRAIDKYLWWRGGGDNDTAAIVRDPWRVIRRLELEAR